MEILTRSQASSAMLFNFMRAGIIAVSMMLWIGPAFAHAGLSAKTRCVNAKLRAASTYISCLLRAAAKANTRGGALSRDQISLCNAEFDRAFDRAQVGGACYTPGGASTLREAIRTQVLRSLHVLTTAGVTCTVSVGRSAVCQVDTATSAVDLENLVNQLSTYGVSDNTTLWIQAWGGDGSNGNVCCSHGGTGGKGGYAQVTTTVSALRNAFGTTVLHYYLGLNGTFAQNAGGDGGTATLVTKNDLSTSILSTADALLIAGGGGGGGAGRGSSTACGGTTNVKGDDGGAGATALFVPAAAADASGLTNVIPGADGVNFDGGYNESGQGGQVTAGGAGNGGDSTPGGDPTAPLGGRGGNHNSPQIGFANALGDLVSGGGGQGADYGNDAGGGGGGGGYTGGGGGNRGYTGSGCNSGGGGGGSSFVREPSGSPTCVAAPTSRPDNPNGDVGFVQITFDLGECGQ